MINIAINVWCNRSLRFYHRDFVVFLGPSRETSIHGDVRLRWRLSGKRTLGKIMGKFRGGGKSVFSQKCSQNEYFFLVADVVKKYSY